VTNALTVVRPPTPYFPVPDPQIWHRLCFSLYRILSLCGLSHVRHLTCELLMLRTP
jgi:hypothetical protein